jgi:P-type Cu+ transporter
MGSLEIFLTARSPCFAGVSTAAAASSITEPGEGVRGYVNGDEIFVGRLAWVRRCINDDASTTVMGSTDAVGKTIVWVGSRQSGLLGRLEFSDVLRAEASQVVRSLYERNMRVVVLSGDDEHVARAVALDAGIDLRDVYGGIKPEGKAAFISQLRSKGASVAMVGDGVNDAVALSASDVGIAMGGGTDAAGAAASVVLMGDRLGQVVEALDLGKATLDKIRQNLVLAVAYNVVGIPVAAGALLPAFGIALSPTVAAGMMACSSIVVVTNSLFLRTAPAHHAAIVHKQI